MLYLDTSALVKLYAAEQGSDDVRRAIVEASMVATATVAYVEARAAFARKFRLGEIAEAVLRRTKRDLDADWSRLTRVDVSEQLVQRAAELAERHELRAYDALHLAAAHLLQATGPQPVRFKCFDHRLNRAAAASGMVVDGAQA